MQVEVKDLKDNKKSLSIEIPKEEVDKKLAKTYATVLTSAAIPGFRKGKASLKILKLYYGKDIKKQVAEELVDEYYQKAIDEKDLKVAPSPEIKEVEVEEGKPLKFEAIVETFAKFNIGEYKGIEIEREKSEVSDKDIDAVLERRREELAELIPVNNRPSIKGDLLTADYHIEIDGKVAKELKNQKLVLGKTPVPKGWEKELTGVKKGDVREIREKAKSEKSKEVLYKFVVKDVQERRLLALDDDFAKKLGDFESLAKAKEKIKAELEEMARFYEEENLRRTVIDKILKNSDIEAPASLIKRFSDYYKSMNKDMSEEESKKLAEENIKKELIVDEIAKKEKIKATDEEISRRKSQITRKEISQEDIREDLKKEKVLKFLIDNAKIKDKAKKAIITPEEENKLSSDKKGSIIIP
ncbi:MAG: trigger factor [Candidatus Omnitrophota bacterium]